MYGFSAGLIWRAIQAAGGFANDAKKKLILGCVCMLGHYDTGRRRGFAASE
jgi:hypothetical protein